MPEYRYCVYGLAIASGLECPQLAPDAGGAAAQVRIELGEVPESLGPGRRQGFKFEATGSELLIRTRRRANLLVSGGSAIRIQRHPGCTDDDLRMLLLGWGMGALLHQRGILPLHAGVVARNGGAVAFCAASGTGKSTLAATLLRRGFRMLDDNLAALDCLAQAPRVLPGSPEVKLDQSAMAFCPEDWQNRLPSWTCGAKTGLLLQPYFEPDSQPLRVIFLMSAAGAPDGPRIRRVKGGEAFHGIHRQVFCPAFLEAMGLSEQHFRKVQDLSNRIPVYALQLGDPKPHPDMLYERISPILQRHLPPH